MRGKGIRWTFWAALSLVLAASIFHSMGQRATGWKIIGWNDLGMHCMDSDYSLFSILPPFNTIHAHVIDPAGNLVVDPTVNGLTVTYEAIADTSGSINTSSTDKTNFWEHVSDLFGASPAVDEGLVGSNMPGPPNTPQPMFFEATHDWFTGEGIPITPYDDGYLTNAYPMMRLVLRDALGTQLASTDVVLPVSSEMDCRGCHGSGTATEAEPEAGWAHESNADRDYRLNILRLHDENQQGNGDYQTALGISGYDAGGLYATAVEQKHPILCAACHGSNALPGTGIPGLTPLTSAIHARHADVTDPDSGMSLDDSDNRGACYQCHPGATTRCLRGAMGGAVEASGALAMQCQSCHGSMSAVGSPLREGWFEEPTCQSCHTGTAVENNGQIRYTSAYEPSGEYRQAVNDTFATEADAPAPGLSLYRFSIGHGGLQCSACHGSTHAIYPSIHGNDNIQNEQIQGHAGTLVDCTACHAISPVTINGGPHGMHPINQDWLRDDHPSAVEKGQEVLCQPCHGLDYRGTVLSESLADRTWDADWIEPYFWRGFRIGCYNCHNGPGSATANNNQPAVVQDAAVFTAFQTSVDASLVAGDADGPMPLEIRIIDQPRHGTVGLTGSLATYYPDRGFAGTDSFTFAAWDGETDSNLGTIDVTVDPPLDPPPVPNGLSVDGSRLRVVELPDGLVRVEWDVLSCPSPSYHLVWYELADVGNYTVARVDCAVDATGEWVGTPPAPNVSVIVVADDGATVEGSHGTASNGDERTSVAAACGITLKTTAAVCE